MTSVTTDSRPERDLQGGPAAAQVSLARLYALRAGYLLIGAGLAVTLWPTFLQDSQQWQPMEAAVNCMLAALSLLAFLGLRYPLRMLPLLLFECAFKLIWFAVVGLPAWAADEMDRATQDVAFANAFVVLILAVIPWRYVLAQYGGQRGEPWR